MKIDFTIKVKNEEGQTLTYNEVSALALAHKELYAMKKLLTYGMVKIGEKAYFVKKIKKD